MIKFELYPEAQALLAESKKWPDKLRENMQAELDAQNLLTVGHAMNKYLSFPKHGPVSPIGLRAVSNRLRNVSHRTKAKWRGGTLTSGIGSAVKYATFHEFGFSGWVGVRMHDRHYKRWHVYRQLGKRKRTRYYQVGKVKAHERLVKQKPRNMFGNAVKDRLAEYEEGMSAAIMYTFEGGVA